VANDASTDSMCDITTSVSDPGAPATSGWRDWLVTPAICLAVYEDDELSVVYPHTDGPETYTVENGLEMLERALLDGSE
jgi:hypothetical protein